VTPGALTRRVAVRGDAATLRHAAGLGNRLQPQDDAGGSLVFQLRP
jgi:hypothetical protein